MDNSIFYNYNRIRSYNALFNFIISNRGGGKTYGAINHADPAVRRFKTEAFGKEV